MRSFRTPQYTWLQGVPPATLQLWLDNAQAALNALMSGGQVASASYGEKSVTYRQTDIGALTAYIHLLQRMLGQVPRQPAITPIFR